MQQAEPSDLELRIRVVGWVRATMHELGLNANKLSLKLDVGRPTVHHLLYDGRCGLSLFNKIRIRLHLSATRMLEEDAPEEFRGLLPAKNAEPMPVEAAEAAEYVNAISDAKTRKKVTAAVRKMLPELKRKHDIRKRSG